MRLVLPFGILALIATPGRGGSNEIPLVAIGLPFAPETPRPATAPHVLYRHLQVAEIERLSATIKSSRQNFIAAAKRSSVNAALRERFERMNFLAPKDGIAHVRLTATWEGSDTPFHIGCRNEATVTCGIGWFASMMRASC